MSRIEDLEKRLSADPNSKIFVQLAEEYRKAGLQEDAIATCRDGLEKHPNYFSARVALGRALLETDGLEEARVEFETVLEQVPDNLLALKFLGETLHKLGLLSEARSKYEVATTLSPGDPDLAERIKQVEAASAAAHAGPSPAADPSAPAGEQSLPPTIPPAKRASQFIEAQAREMTSDQLSDDVLSMQEEFEDRPVTSIFKRTAREIQDLGTIPKPAPKGAAPPAEPVRPPEESSSPPSPTGATEGELGDQGTGSASPRETATIDLGGAPIDQLKKSLGKMPSPPGSELPEGKPVPSEEAPSIEPIEPIMSSGPSGQPPLAEAPAPVTPSPADALNAVGTGRAEESDEPGLATTTLAELYVSQGHLDRAVNVYRQIVASNPDNPELQSRLEELELLVAASQESKRPGAAGSPGATPLASPADPNVRFLEQAIRELESWLAALGKS